MSIVIVSDVFGKTPELNKLADELNAEKIIDPYNGVSMGFKSEKEAYTYFIEEVGLNTYLVHLEEVVKSFSTSKVLIGFSVGAAIVWRLSGTIVTDSVYRAFCYYGSQIRNFTGIEPTFEIDVILPKYEEHFDIDALESNLSKMHNVKTIKTHCLHGFMNKHSVNFNKVAYRENVEMLRLSAN